MRKLCKRNHELSSNNTYRNSRGSYECLDCRKISRGSTFDLKQILDVLNTHKCNIGQIAEHLKTSPETIYNWISSQTPDIKQMLKVYRRPGAGIKKELVKIPIKMKNRFVYKETPDNAILSHGISF